MTKYLSEDIFGKTKIPPQLLKILLVNDTLWMVERLAII